MTSTNAVLAVLHPSVPANSLQEFIAYAKANPGKVAAGVAGSGSLLHLATELLKAQAGIDLLVVPYKGSGPAVTDLLGGQVQLLIDAPPVTMTHVKAGKLKAIAVTGKTRLAALPEVPTFEEAGVPDRRERLAGRRGAGWHAARSCCEALGCAREDDRAAGRPRQVRHAGTRCRLLVRRGVFRAYPRRGAEVDPRRQECKHQSGVTEKPWPPTSSR